MLALVVARICLGRRVRHGAAAALAAARDRRQPSRRVLVSPLVVAALAGFETGRINSPFTFSADLANLVVPTKLTLVGGDLPAPDLRSLPRQPRRGRRLPRAPAARCCALLEARETWSRRASRIAPLCVALALVCALGPVLRIAGVAVAPLPWLPLAYLPPFENILPVRLVAYAALAAGLCVASYLARRATPGAHRARAASRSRRPSPRSPPTSGARPAPIPPGLRGAAVSRILTPGEVVLVLPVRRPRARDAVAGRGRLPLPPGGRLPAARSAGDVRARPRGRGAARRHAADDRRPARVPARGAARGRSSSTRPTCPPTRAPSTRSGSRPSGSEGCSSTGSNRLLRGERLEDRERRLAACR